MRLMKASEDDNERLLHYFAKSTMPGRIEHRIRRMFNFYNQYRIQTEDFNTYILENEFGEIEAMASLLFRQATVEKGTAEKDFETVAYATDLRVSPTRAAIRNWSKYFLPVLEEERNARNCRYIFSCVPSSQRQAYNTFIRPRNLRRGMPRYHMFRKFELVTLHGLWPFPDLPLHGIKIRRATESDMTQLSEYILKKTASRPLRPYANAQDIQLSIDRWRDLFIENFILAFDKSGNMIGCVAPWSPDRVQTIQPVRYNSTAENFRDMLTFMSWMRIARPISKVNQDFKFRHLTHLYADNPDIFYSLLYHAYEQAGPREFLVYCHFENDLISMPPRGFIATETPYALYCILSPNDPMPDFLKPSSLQAPPVFESAWV